MLTRYDELPHAVVPSDPLWRESYYMNFFDHEKEIYGIAWMGVRPNIGHGEILFAIGRGNRWLHSHQDFQIPIAQDIGGDRVGFGPLTFDVIDPYRNWRVTFDDGVADVELEWQATTSVYNWEWQETASSWHYQHPGTVTGRITIGDETLDFEGYGERDRAWGKRDNHYFESVHWNVAQFPNDVYFESMHLKLTDRTDMYGFVKADGEESLLAHLELRPTYAYPGGPPVAADITARDRLGREFRIQQELMNVVAMGQAAGGLESRQYFTFNRYTLDGVKGYGMMDHWWSRFDALGSVYIGEEPNRGRLYELDGVALGPH
jgi:hypothetical protein